MRSSTKDTTKGTMQQLKGKAKEGAGKISGNVSLENQGKAEKISGKVQKGFGKVERNLEEE